ncbi:hypothetical protein EV138_7026 [Kribbella voronezhensis]|uniref:Uncharacterized protein n=1 Tax=Kribbella voronezhensis TaxID=2512212 RepID=A0A4R7T100_9ACTN|nr:hypothetical protein [Kribbella voronezhensis]TDU84547.1 hypothetical protein EV138_7026 [Kribbella voronezhensis]
MAEVEVPRMRRDVMDSLAVLADREYQERAWVRKEGFKLGQHDDFDYHVHVLYDDTEVLRDPKAAIGSVLLPGDEADRLEALGEVLDRLLEEHGDVDDIAYLRDPRWPEVVRLAGLALAAMVRE